MDKRKLKQMKHNNKTSQTNNVHIARLIPPNAALILNDKNDLSGIEADPDVEENLEAVQQRLLIDSMEIPNIHEYTKIGRAHV